MSITVQLYCTIQRLFSLPSARQLWRCDGWLGRVFPNGSFYARRHFHNLFCVCVCVCVHWTPNSRSSGLNLSELLHVDAAIYIRFEFILNLLTRSNAYLMASEHMCVSGQAFQQIDRKILNTTICHDKTKTRLKYFPFSQLSGYILISTQQHLFEEGRAE